MKWLKFTTDASLQLPFKKRKSVLVNSIKNEMTDTWLNHLKDLVVQGDMLRIALLENADHLWKSFIFNMPKGVMKFI